VTEKALGFHMEGFFVDRRLDVGVYVWNKSHEVIILLIFKAR
jgi:hypothetical protein